MPSSADAIALIGLDWGSTHLRAFALDAAGNVLAVRRSEAGALTLSGEAQFNAALEAIAGDWVRAAPRAPLLACGMVGARAGWREAAYVPCGSAATRAPALAAATLRVATALGPTLHIVPGMASAEPDVMRGEETLLLGADIDTGVVVLPGTHSKWVQLRDGGIERFSTFCTGEMNALIRAHGAVGQSLFDATTQQRVAPDLADRAAFARGIALARDARQGWLHELFVLRASVVTGVASPAAVSTMLGGWLLGSEFVAALTAYPRCQSITLISGATLAPWYEATAHAFGLPCTVLDADPLAARGLWQIGRRLTHS
ncbi:MAG: 2-dehydro-3-deoxygalactonokinase [Burkholderiales bacterium]|nr:2-dehydro-3-deoxygalactonokinase [Burkholderiales bacterium]